MNWNILACDGGTYFRWKRTVAMEPSAHEHSFSSGERNVVWSFISILATWSGKEWSLGPASYPRHLGTYYKCRFSGLALVSLHFHKVSGWFCAQFGLRSPALEKAVWAALPPSPSPSGRALFWGTLRPVEGTLFYGSVYWLVLLRFVKIPEIPRKQSLGEIDFISLSWSLMEQNGFFLLFIWSFCWVWERHAAGCG